MDADCAGNSDFDADADSFDSDAYGGTDCDDALASTFPGATDRWYDGVDADCAGNSDFDRDGDGFDSSVYGGTDCADGNRFRFPGARERWYDGIDQDCSGGSDYDADADAYDSSLYGGTDCNDAVATINPGATETWYDGVDGDCAGGDDFDADADSFTALAYGGTDCLDTDPAVFPGATDTWYDGVDGDCAGNSDYDRDADGYDSDAYGGTDCADGNPFRSPGRAEVWYDGSDDDCSGGSDYDADSDGYDGDEWGGADCNDTLDDMNPGLPEVPDDGYDNDCDGVAERGTVAGGYSVDGADYTIRGAVAGDRLGQGDPGIAPAGDVNGDGAEDFIVGAIRNNPGTGAQAGAAYLVNGPITGTFTGRIGTLADATLRGEAAGDLAGRGVTGLGDVDGDGFDDILVAALNNDTGATNAGKAYLVLGPISGTVNLSAADARLWGNSANMVFAEVAPAGDMNNDGRPDFLVGAQADDVAGTDAGAVYLFNSPWTASGSVATLGIRITGANAGDGLGASNWSAGDVDGDGFDDFVVGALGEDSGVADAGAVYVVYGPVTSGGSISSLADGVRYGEEAGARIGQQVSVAGAGDTDGDGLDDLIVGSQDDDDGAENAGAAYVLRGPVTGSASLATADAKLLGWTPGDYVGDAVNGPGDIDGDGFDDLLIGSGYADFGATNGGAVYLVRGPVSGTQSLQFAWTTLWTEGAEDRGRGRGIGDVDGDGRPDVAITAQLNDGGGTDAGAAFLFFAAGL